MQIIFNNQWCGVPSVLPPLPVSLLIVDDNPWYGAFFEDYFATQSVICARAWSAKEGIDYLKKQKFDAVLTDMSMESEMAGLRVLRFCRKQHFSGQIWVATTALNRCWTLPFLRIFYAQCGAHFLIPKAPIRQSGVLCFLPGRAFVKLPTE